MEDESYRSTDANSLSTLETRHDQNSSLRHKGCGMIGAWFVAGGTARRARRTGGLGSGEGVGVGSGGSPTPELSEPQDTAKIVVRFVPTTGLLIDPSSETRSVDEIVHRASIRARNAIKRIVQQPCCRLHRRCQQSEGRARLRKGRSGFATSHSRSRQSCSARSGPGFPMSPFHRR